MATVMTVGGPVRAEELGLTLIHEHLFLDLTRDTWTDNNFLSDPELTLQELQRFEAARPVYNDPNDLRHGAATMMLEAGETVPTVSEYLGHASPAITMMVYAHAVPGSKKRAAERLGAVLRSARATAEQADPESSTTG